MKLQNVLHVPGLNENLFSIGRACDSGGAEIVFTKNRCKISVKGRTLFNVPRENGVFRLRLGATSAAAMRNPESAMAAFGARSSKELHRRYGHINGDTRALMSKAGIIAKMADTADPRRACEVCLKGKMTRTAIPKVSTRQPTDPGALVHNDLCGPMRTPSIQVN